MATLGTAQININVNTETLQAGLDRAKNLTQQYSSEAQQAYTASSNHAKSAGTSLMRYTELIGKSADEVRLLRAQWAGVPQNVIVESAEKMRRLRQEIEGAAKASREMSARSDFIKALEDQAKTAGKTRSEILELRAAEMGLSAQAAPLIAQIKAVENASARGATQFNAYGKSAKEVQLAMRQVPAQMTDIFVSLAGGMNPMMVLIQQGGQLRDVFGGIAPAASALGGALKGLISPWTLLAGVVVAAGYALIESDNRMSDFGLSLAKAGNMASTTAEHLSSLADSIDHIDGVTRGAADGSIKALVEGTRLSGEQFDRAAEATARWASVSGESADTIAQKFAEMGRDPYEALLKLAEAGGDVSASQLEQAKSLVESGNSTAAAQIAWDAYIDALNSRSSEAEATLSNLARLWREVKDAAMGAWAAFGGAVEKGIAAAGNMLQNIDRAGNNFFNAAFTGSVNPADRLRNIIGAGTDYLAGNAKALNDGFHGDGPLTRKARAEKAARDRAAAAAAATNPVSSVTPEQAAAQRRLDTLTASDKTKQQRLADHITQIGNAALAAGKSPEEIKTLQDQARAAYADSHPGKKPKKGGSGAHALEGAERRQEIDAIKQDAAIERNEIQNTTKILQANFAARNITEKEYYAERKRLAKQDTDTQAKSIEAQIAALKGKGSTEKDGVDIARQVTALEAQLAQVRSDGATTLKVLEIEEKAAADARKRASDELQRALNQQVEATKQTYKAEVARLTLGGRQYEVTMAIAEATRQYSKNLQELENRKANGKMTPEQIAADEAAILKTFQDTLQAIKEGFDAVSAAQADWLGGLNAGIADWVQQAMNVSDATRQLTTHAFDGVTDGLLNTFNGVKAGWKDMLRDMLIELEKFLIKKAVAQFVLSFGNAVWGTGTGDTDGNIGWAKGGVADTNGITAFAKGAAFTNAIVNQPTMFKFAKGSKFGVMGEAGPEAVMPLARDAQGRLGVRMAGGVGGDVQVGVTVNIFPGGKSETDVSAKGPNTEQARAAGEQLKAIVHKEVDNMMRPGGKLHNAGVRA